MALYPRRGSAAQQLAVGAGVMLVISGILALVGLVQGALAFFAFGIAFLAFRLTHSP